MKRSRFLIAFFVLLSLIVALLSVAGCDKERIVESTEYVHDIEYLESPPDTIFVTDTIFSQDSVSVPGTDTIIVTDTVVQVNNYYDTVMVEVVDTIVTVQHHYDTVTVAVVDTVLSVQCDPNPYFAIIAMQYHTDPLVYEFVNQEFGLSDGYIFYLSSYQIEITAPSATSYDIYGYIDYWTTDLSGYYMIEYYWRVTYLGGDPLDMENWQLSEPPAKTSGHVPGINMSTEPIQIERTLNR